jgi:hypothetical protein
MDRQVVVAFVAGTPVEIAHMVTVVLAEQKGAVALQGLIPFSGEHLNTQFKWDNQDEPEGQARPVFVCYAIFLVPEQVVFDCRTRIHIQSLGLSEAAQESPPSTPPDPILQ